MKKKLLALLFGTSLVLAACGGGGDTDEGATSESEGTSTASAGNAEKIYGQYCASCHGADLSGGVGSDLRTIGATKSKDDILAVIENGQGSMPGGLISGDDAQAVAEWLAEKK